MFDASVPSQIEIPVIRLSVQPGMRDGALEVRQTFLPERTADEFPDSGNKEVKACDGRCRCRRGRGVVVQAHVEWLQRLRIVCHEYRRAEFLAGEVLLVLGLQAGAPLGRVFEWFDGMLFSKDRYGFGVGYSDERSIRHLPQSGYRVDVELDPRGAE